MEFGKLNRLVLGGGLSIVAALLLSGAAFAQDAAADGGATGPITQVVIIDDSGAATDDVGATVNQYVDTTAGDPDIAVGEPDPNDGSDAGTGDPGIDPATDYGTADGTGDGTIDGTVDETVDGTETDGDGVVVIYTMESNGCIDCNVVSPGRPTNPSEVERTLTTAAAATTAAKRHSPAAALAVTSSMVQCLAEHPRSAWICEWQNGAGQ